jgi:hypothetical protein
LSLSDALYESALEILKKVNNALYGWPRNVFPCLALTLQRKCYGFIGIAIQNNMAKSCVSK